MLLTRYLASLAGTGPVKWAADECIHRHLNPFHTFHLAGSCPYTTVLGLMMALSLMKIEERQRMQSGHIIMGQVACWAIMQIETDSWGCGAIIPSAVANFAPCTAT